MDEIKGIVRAVLGLGLESRDIDVAQMVLRAVVVYVVTVVIVRLGKKRFMGRTTAFDVILGIMLGSIVSRAITGNAPFGPALAASAVLVAMHSLFSWVAMYWHWFGGLIKGHSEVLIRVGQVDERKMRKAHMTDKDLWEDLRGKSIARLDEVAEGRLERNGSLSIVKAKSEPKIIDIRVADGVQTVRVELG
jgi:uncharacterized membrane protein YcaP (DUF421 family)